MDNNETLEVGSVVFLRSGGPLMTVEEIFYDGNVMCLWFDKHIRCDYKFHHSTLIIVTSITEDSYSVDDSLITIHGE